MIYQDKITDIVDRFSEKIAIICREGKYSFKKIHENSNAIIAGFYDLGLRKGDKIALLCRNCHHCRQMFWVAGKGGFVLIPVNSRLKPDEISYIINNSEARALVVSKETENTLSSLRAGLKNIQHCFSVDKEARDCIFLDDLIFRYPKDDHNTRLTDEDMLWFQYTSGTTGLPKGAMHTHGTAAEIIDICTGALKGKGPFNEDSVALQVLPSYSFAGVAFDLLYQSIGSTTIIMEKFDTREMMALIERYKVTDCHIVPVIANFILNSPDFGKYDLSSLKCLTYGGAPMPDELLKKAIDKMGPIFMQDYGASEAGALTFLDIEDHVIDGPPKQLKRLKSCGKPIPGIDVTVLNNEGKAIRPGEIGELTVRSKMVMKGYWKMPRETDEALKNGRFYTGDLCTVDKEGYIYVMDRKKDLIISGGFNIYPHEVESVILEHRGIIDAAVIGIPDDQWGEAVCALVVPYKDNVPSESEIIEFVKTKIASYKKPKKVEFVERIPRTLSGKILKKELRSKYWEGRERKV